MIGQFTKKNSFSDPLPNTHLNSSGLVVENQLNLMKEEEVKKEMKKLLTADKSVEHFENLHMVDEEDYFLLPSEYFEFVEKKSTLG